MEVTSEPDHEILRIARTDDPPTLHLEGELDPTRHKELADALSSMRTDSGEVHVDLAGLRFIDLGALNLLTTYAARGDESRFVLHNLSSDIQQLIEMIGWERLPGLIQGRKEKDRS
jgi:anti-anti-sigma factor